MHVKYALIGATLLLGLLIGACKQDPPVVPGPEFCDTATVSFTNDIVPIMAIYCNNPSFGDCHQAGSYWGELITFNGVRAKVDNGTMDLRLFGWQDQPPPNTDGPRLVSPFELTLIDCWIAQGAQDN
ncbi:MAG: hypothetical protein AAF570_14885 [Bacteroidota bacterium]